jgi:hypothetical protein
MLPDFVASPEHVPGAWGCGAGRALRYSGVRRMRRWAWNEPWMALTATIATFCAVTVIALRWLVMLGVVRVYTVTRTTGSLESTYSSTFLNGHLGLASGPSAALTNLDRWTWKVGLLAGIFWMLRLGLRSAGRRIGVLRCIGVVTGFGVFVVTGVMHVIAAVVSPVDSRARLDRLITAWCAAVVVAACMVVATGSLGQPSGPPTLGDQALAIPVAWSIARGAMQLGVALGGWLLAASLTRRWVVSNERLAERPRAPLGEPA